MKFNLQKAFARSPIYGMAMRKRCAQLRNIYSQFMTTAQFFKNFFYYLSPFSMVIAFSLIIGLFFRGDPYHTERWTNQASSIFIPAFFILGTLYVIIRLILKERILLIWIIEALILLLFYCFVFM